MSFSIPAGVNCVCCHGIGKRDATALAEASWNGPSPGWMEQLGALGSVNSDGQHNNVRHGITIVTSVTSPVYVPYSIGFFTPTFWHLIDASLPIDVRMNSVTHV